MATTNRDLGKTAITKVINHIKALRSSAGTLRQFDDIIMDMEDEANTTLTKIWLCSDY